MSIDLSKTEAVAQVDEHNASVRKRGSDRACYVESCARCHASDSFRPHDVRRRGLRFILPHGVLVIIVWLARWQCRKCGHRFTDYPDFRTPVQALRRPVVAAPG